MRRKSWQQGQHKHTSHQKNITLERKAIPDANTVRSEYLNGKVIGMGGSNRAHNLITGNIAAELHGKLKSSKCEVLMNEMRVSIPSAKCYFYPDIVVCEEPRFEDDEFDTLLNPIVIVEVLSPTTETYDRGEKLSHYLQLQSLKEYILVSQDRVNATSANRMNGLIPFFKNLSSNFRLPQFSANCLCRKYTSASHSLSKTFRE